MCAGAAVLALLSLHVRRFSGSVRPRPDALSMMVRSRSALFSRPQAERIEPLYVVEPW
jgi:hypothetical protein